MALLNICGWETGDASEAAATNGTFSVQSTTKRTGTYALRVNPVASFGYNSFRKMGADGDSASIGGTSCYIGFYFRYATLPAAETEIFFFDAGARYLISITPSGTLRLFYNNGLYTLVGSASSALSSGVWYRVEFSIVNSGTSGSVGIELRLDGAVVATGTNLTPNATGTCTVAYCGSASILAASTMDIFYDDFAMSDSAYPGPGQVNILKPNATGNYTGWANGAGTAPTNVAETPPDGNTSYIVLTNPASAPINSSMGMDSATTGGVLGAIYAVKTTVVATGSGGGFGPATGLRSGTTDSWTSGAGDYGTVYHTFAKVFETDPATSAAWTSSGVDGLEVAIQSTSAGSPQSWRCTAMYAMVWNAGVVLSRPKARTAFWNEAVHRASRW